MLTSRIKIVMVACVAALALSACSRESAPESQAVPQEVAPEPEQPGESEGAKPEPAPQPVADAAVDAREEWIIWADGDPWDGPAPLTVEFECDLMEEVPDPKYEWDFGDGSAVSTESHPTHTYARPGRYTARCRVTDPEGGMGEDSLVIEVDPPEAEAGQPAEGD